MGTQLVVVPATYDFYYWFSNGTRTGTPSQYESYRRSRSWATTANYKKIVRSQLRTLGYTDSNMTQRVGSVKVSFPGVNGGCAASCALFTGRGSPSLSDNTITELLNSAISTAAEKTGGYDFDLGVAAAEGKKTGEMLFKAASTLVSAARDVRRLNFAKAARTLGIGTPTKCRSNRTFESNWLEYRYGWRTLMMDVDGAMKALANSMVDKPPIFVVKSVKKTSITAKVGPVRQGIAGGLGFEDAIVTRLYTDNYEASITYRFSMQHPNLSGANSLGLVNLQALAWELVPMSFVVDWFVNVGDVLRNMTSFYGKTFLDGTKCLMHETEIVSSMASYRTKVSNYPLVYSSGVGPPANSYVKSREFSRVQLKNFLTVTPRLNVSINIGRALDAGALLRQYFHR